MVAAPRSLLHGLEYRATQVKRCIFRSELSPLIRPDHLLEDLRSIEALLGPRAAAVNRRLEVPVLVSALAVLPMFFIELVATEGWLPVVAVAINWLIWVVFTIEFVLLFSLTERRPAYLRKALLHFSVVIFAFPLLLNISPDLEGAFRTLRFIVLMAAFVQSSVTLDKLLKHVFFDLLAVARHPWMFVIGPLLRKRGLGLVILIFFGLAVLAGLIHSLFETYSPIEGLWWALVTLTTVGYGDIAPVTLGGRITGAILMLSGIGVLAFITASIAAHFVEGDHKGELHEEVQTLNGRLDSIDHRLDRIEKLLSAQDPTDSDD